MSLPGTADSRVNFATYHTNASLIGNRPTRPDTQLRIVPEHDVHAASLKHKASPPGSANSTLNEADSPSFANRPERDSSNLSACDLKDARSP
eukprot:2736421-Pleurochrysis_carterae.AAC.1